MGQGWNDLSELATYNSDPVNKSEQAKGNNLLIVDAFNVAFRWKHSKYTLRGSDKTTDPDMLVRPTGFAEDYCKTVRSLATSYSASKIALTADRGKSTYRLNIFPEYKGNRDYSRQTPAERQMFSWFCNDYEDALNVLQETIPEIVLFRYKGVEADDIAAHICFSEKIKNAFDHIWLVSSDKDWDQLVCDTVSRFNWATQNNWKAIDGSGKRPKEIRVDNWEKHHVGSISEYLSYRVLEGDTSDGIPGVAQVGPARADTLIKKYGSMQNILKNMPLPGRAVYINNMNNAKEQLELNWKLMDLTDCDKAIGNENLEKVECQMDSLV